MLFSTKTAILFCRLLSEPPLTPRYKREKREIFNPEYNSL
ncbi:hypothetical protein TRIP_D430025 [uncultured Paludibacter sp.]|uniref:Uncharacterized protein n=1 Tax=uncultured Paludibacter sp. TaxID=497635 RepID=A0A653AIS8_9BACT|nr:hypothetical protein TRIP_D430025 [uncultured Paludibacter sp.]